MLPPEDYRVVTDEEVIEGLSFTTHHRISTEIFVPAEAWCAVEMMTIETAWTFRLCTNKTSQCLPCTPWWDGQRTLLPPSRRRGFGSRSRHEDFNAAQNMVSCSTSAKTAMSLALFAAEGLNSLGEKIQSRRSRDLEFRSRTCQRQNHKDSQKRRRI
jgi:hypothetical protein